MRVAVGKWPNDLNGPNDTAFVCFPPGQIAVIVQKPDLPSAIVSRVAMQTQRGRGRRNESVCVPDSEEMVAETCLLQGITESR